MPLISPSSHSHFCGCTLQHSRRQNQAGPVSTPFLLCVLAASLFAVCESMVEVVVEHPRPSAELNFIPDIPLWVRIYVNNDTTPRCGRHCFELFLDGESQTITCERDTILDGVTPQPGMHHLALVATFLPSAHGPVAESTFTVLPGAQAPSPPACVHEYHKWWHSSNIWMHTTWRGVIARKAPTDMWNYQEILRDLKPTLLIEFGDVLKTIFGASASTATSGAVAAAPVSEGSPQKESYKILTVDIEPWIIDAQVFKEPNVEVLTAPTAARRVQKRISEIRKDLPGPAFAILDADHGAANVTLELQMLVPVLKPGDYVIVEDTNLDGHEHAVAPGWGPSPYDAITQFMAMNRDVFERDLHREVKFGFSQAMAGFLRFRGAPEDGDFIYPLSENPYLDD